MSRQSADIILIIINFLKFLHIVPLRSKTGKDVTTAFLSILIDRTYSGHVRRRPIMVRTDKGKKFVNKTFQDSYVLSLHRGHGIGNFLSGLFRADRPVRWSGGKEFVKRH